MSTNDIFLALGDALAPIVDGDVISGPPRFGRAPIDPPVIAIRLQAALPSSGMSIGDSPYKRTFLVVAVARNEPELMDVVDQISVTLDTFDPETTWNAQRLEPIYGVEDEDYAFQFTVEV